MAAEKKTATPTEYIVLRQVKPGPSATGKPGEANDASYPECWVVVNPTPSTARSQEEAIKDAADRKHEGVYIAVASRSFRPLKVTPKTTVQLELTEAKQ